MKMLRNRRRGATGTPADGEVAHRRTAGLAERIVRGFGEQSGSTMLEMAVVLPTFFLLLFGLIEFGVIIFGYGSATFACQTAVRYASVHSSTSLSPCTAGSVAAIVATQIFAPSSYPVVGVHTTWPTGNTVGNPVNVAVTLYYPAGLPVLSTAMITLNTSSQRIIVR